MTIADFLSDRLGRIVLQGGCAAAAALFLLATGTQPGVVALLLMGLILVFLCWRSSGSASGSAAAWRS